MERSFTLEYWIDDNYYVGKIKEVPGVFSQGETLDELEGNIKDAYHMMLEEETIPFDVAKISSKDVVIHV